MSQSVSGLPPIHRAPPLHASPVPYVPRASVSPRFLCLMTHSSISVMLKAVVFDPTQFLLLCHLDSANLVVSRAYICVSVGKLPVPWRSTYPSVSPKCSFFFQQLWRHVLELGHTRGVRTPVCATQKQVSRVCLGRLLSDFFFFLFGFENLEIEHTATWDDNHI